MTDRTPDERIAELEARLAMVVEVCSTQRSALMDLLAALEFEFTAMSRAKLLPRGDELNHHFAHFLSRVKDLDITPMEPTVAAFIERVEARGAARATNELAILRNARKVGEHYLRECIESRQSSDRSGNITNSWAVVVIPDWQFRQMLYGIEPEARAAELEGA